MIKKLRAVLQLNLILLNFFLNHQSHALEGVMSSVDGEKVVYANSFTPALTFRHLPADHDINIAYTTTSFRLERQNSQGSIDDAPWFFAAFRAEMGMTYYFNTYGYYGAKPTIPGIEVGTTISHNVADHGNFGFDGVLFLDYLSGGGMGVRDYNVTLSSSSGSTVNLDFDSDGEIPLPGSIVALSKTKANAVTVATEEGLKVPFLVNKVQLFEGKNRVLVSIAGIGSVKAIGPINIGDPLITSKIKGVAKAGLGYPAHSTVGSSLTSLPDGQIGLVKIKIGMVSSK